MPFLLVTCLIIKRTNIMISSVLRSIITIIVGVVLIYMRDGAVALLIRIAGAAFLLPALVSLSNLYVNREVVSKVALTFMTIINVGCVAFGLWLLLNPLSFQNLFVKLMAVLIFLIAFNQIVAVVASRRPVKVALSMLVTPLLLAVVAIYLFTSVELVVGTVILVLGICAVVSGVSDLVIAFVVRKKMRSVVVERVVDEENVAKG